MPGMDLTGDWQEAKAGLLDDAGNAAPMTDGETYVVQFIGSAGAAILAVDVEGAGPPASDANALVYFNRTRDGDGEREFTARAGWTWWLKAEGGDSRLVAAEV